MKKVCVRFAPSPTGFLHIGSLRTALFNWLFARQNKGKFILRIEDTDRERYVEGSVENIIEALKWYGLDFDDGPIFQSQRLAVYKKFSRQLLERGSAYYCFCSTERLTEVRKIQAANKQATKYDGLCRSLTAEEVKKKLSAREPHVVRLKVPAEGQTNFNDLIYGHISVENKNIDDQVLVKSDGFPTYHLANVIDDHEEGITHVIRAEEWLPSTAKHILLYRAFNWPLPVFSHLPMVLGPDRAKLSKRHGALPALEYKKRGYLPEAVLNFIALLGWNPKTDREIFTLKELIKEFDLIKVNKASAIFNVEKLDWLNSQYIKKMPLDDLVKSCQSYLNKPVPAEKFKKIIKLTQDRLKNFSDINRVAPFFFAERLNYNPKILMPKNDNKERIVRALEATMQIIASIDEKDFTQDNLKNIFAIFIKERHLNNRIVLWPLRVALTGLEKSPGVFEVMEILGKEAVLERGEQAKQILKKI